ncbi:MAG: Aldehyde dehydrogenase B, partial [uncultured Thermomicrobiales bacterium]
GGPVQELRRRPLAGSQGRCHLHPEQPGQRRAGRRLHQEQTGGRRRRRRRRGRGVHVVAPLPGAEAGRDPLPRRPDPARSQGSPRPRDDRGDGQGPDRGPGRRPRSDRHDLLHGRRGAAPVRANDAVRDAQQVPDGGPQAARRLRRRHPLELPARHPVLEDDAGPDRRQHHRLQTGQLHLPDGRAAGRDPGGGRVARRRRQPGDGHRGRGRQRDRRPPGRAAGLVHRLERDRDHGRRRRGEVQQARLPGDGRQERGDRDGRRRPGFGDRGHPLERLWHLRPALHRCQPGGGPPERAAGTGRAPGGPRRRDATRRRPRRHHRHRPNRQRTAARPDQRLRQDRPGRRRPPRGRRRDRPRWRAWPRLLPPADDLRRGRPADAHRPRRDLRPGHGLDPGRDLGRGDRRRQRRRLRPFGVDLHRRRQPRLPRDAGHRHRHPLRQRRHHRRRDPPPLRRNQGHRQRPPRGGHRRPRLLHRVAEHLRRLLRQAATGADRPRV